MGPEIYLGRDLYKDKERHTAPRIQRIQMSSFENRRLVGHWHEEGEVIVNLKGEFCYQVENERICLKEEEGLFVNGGALHRGFGGGKNCELLLLRFSKEQLGEGTSFFGSYAAALFGMEEYPFIRFGKDTQNGAGILEEMKQAALAWEEGKPGYEELLNAGLKKIWIYLFREGEGQRRTLSKTKRQEIRRLYQMLAYMKEHEKEKLTLSQIAEVAKLSEGESCRFFKRIMEQTPFEYLQAVKIERSLAMLADRRLSITEAAQKSGFSGSSYYAEIFKKQMECSPGEYRKWYRSGEPYLKEEKEPKEILQKEEAPENIQKTVQREERQKERGKEAPVTTKRQSMPTHLL